MYDPEGITGYRDADIEMAQLAEAADWPTCSRCFNEVHVKAGEYNDQGVFVCNRCRIEQTKNIEP